MAGGAMVDKRLTLVLSVGLSFLFPSLWGILALFHGSMSRRTRLHLWSFNRICCEYSNT